MGSYSGGVSQHVGIVSMEPEPVSDRLNSYDQASSRLIYNSDLAIGLLPLYRSCCCDRVASVIELVNLLAIHQHLVGTADEFGMKLRFLWRGFVPLSGFFRVQMHFDLSDFFGAQCWWSLEFMTSQKLKKIVRCRNVARIGPSSGEGVIRYLARAAHHQRLYTA